MLFRSTNISLLFPLIINELVVVEKPLVIADLPSLNSQLIVSNLNITIIEVNLLLVGISGYALLSSGLLVLLIQLISLNKIAEKERIFAMAFSILYSIGQANFNTA